jgi:hypothetical protein
MQLALQELGRTLVHGPLSLGQRTRLAPRPPAQLHDIYLGLIVQCDLTLLAAAIQTV